VLFKMFFSIYLSILNFVTPTKWQIKVKYWLTKKNHKMWSTNWIKAFLLCPRKIFKRKNLQLVCKENGLKLHKKKSSQSGKKKEEEKKRIHIYWLFFFCALIMSLLLFFMALNVFYVYFHWSQYENFFSAKSWVMETKSYFK